MSLYVYKAKNTSAQTITGHVDAQNQEEALETIYRQGLVPVSIEEETSRGMLVSNIRTRSIKAKELHLFTKQLAGLIKSGVALLKALDVISKNTRNPYLARVVGDIAAGVKTGRTFSACLGDYPFIFSPFYVAMARVGEEMGHLREVLSDLAEFHKRQDEISAKVQGALVYPLVMLGVGTATVVFILTFVMPKITGIFTISGQVLPWPTRVVMSASHFLQMFWAPMAAALCGGIFVFNSWRASAKGRTAMGRFLLAVPFLRNLIVMADVARFGRSMHLLLESGLPLVRSIEISAPTIHNPQLRSDLFLCVEALSAGESLGSCLARSAYFPEVFTQTLAIAEETGSLNESLKDIADSCESDVNDTVKTITTLLEPLMILGVGVVVGFIVFAMLLPIFSMDLLAQ